MTCFGLALVVEGVCVCMEVDSSSVLRSFSRGRIRALSAPGEDRRGRVDRRRVVARRRWLQKRQCWVRIGRFVGEDILRFEGWADGGVWWMGVVVGVRRMSDSLSPGCNSL